MNLIEEMEYLKDLIEHSLDIMDDTAEESPPETLNACIDEVREKLREALKLF